MLFDIRGVCLIFFFTWGPTQKESLGSPDVDDPSHLSIPNQIPYLFNPLWFLNASASAEEYQQRLQNACLSASSESLSPIWTRNVPYCSLQLCVEDTIFTPIFPQLFHPAIAFTCTPVSIDLAYTEGEVLQRSAQLRRPRESSACVDPEGQVKSLADPTHAGGCFLLSA